MREIVKCEWCLREIHNPKYDQKNCSRSHRNSSRELRNARDENTKSIVSRFYTLKRRMARGELVGV